MLKCRSGPPDPKLIAHHISDDGLTITTNYDGSAAVNHLRQWFIDNDIEEPHYNKMVGVEYYTQEYYNNTTKRYDLIFHNYEDAMLFWLTYNGPISSTTAYTMLDHYVR